jgi:hypothetical protein
VRRLPDHPAVPCVLAALVAVVLVAARLVFGTHGDITQFIVVGNANLAGHGLPSGIHVFAGSGYDGQFYFRQALGPFDVSTVAHGIRLDGEYRLQRLAYPAIAYVMAAGRAGLVPYALVAVNVLGLAIVGLLGGLIARDSGRHAVEGLLLAGYFGLVTTLARDLTEIVEACFLLAALVALRRGRYVLAALAFSGAVATKETEVFTVLAVGLVIIGRALLARVGRGSAPAAAAHLVWLLPALSFAGIQLWLYEATGQLAGRSGAQGNFATPLTAPVHALAHYLAHPTTLADAIWLGELAVLVVVVVVALVCISSTKASLEERVALVMLMGLALSLSGEVWNGQADFRSLAPLFELAAVVLLGSRIRLGVLYAIVGVAFLVTYVHRVRFI